MGIMNEEYIRAGRRELSHFVGPMTHTSDSSEGAGGGSYYRRHVLNLIDTASTKYRASTAMQLYKDSNFLNERTPIAGGPDCR